MRPAGAAIAAWARFRRWHDAPRKVDYPEPFTLIEIERFKREHSMAEVQEYHKEREYIVDRQLLKRVEVVLRYPQISNAEFFARQRDGCAT
jgi:hypothetical protein